MSAFFILVVLSVASATDLESVRISFSQKALDFAEEIAKILFDVVKDEAPKKLEISDISTSKFKLRNMKLQSIDIYKPTITSVPLVGLALSNVVDLKVTGKWSVKAGWWWIDGSMTLETKITAVAITAITEKNDRLATSPLGCDVAINEFDLDLHNGFITWVVGLMKGKITPEIKKTVCSEVNGILRTTANQMIASLPHDIPVGDLFDVKIAADSNPIFGRNHIKIPARVKVDRQGSPADFPFSPQPMVSSMDVSYMACLLVSDYTLNTGSYIALPAGRLDVTLPNQDIKASHPFFNTIYFESILPELYTAYPDMALSLKIVNTRYPLIEFDVDRVFINMPVDLTLQVSGQSVVKLQVDLSVNAALQHSNKVISGEVLGSTHTTTLVSSTLSDEILLKQLSDVVDEVLALTILPEVNVILKQGITLPIPDYVVLNKGLIEAHDDFLKVCVDMDITDKGKEELKKIAESLLD